MHAFSIESDFHLDGIVNMQHVTFWDNEHPYKLHEKENYDKRKM
jgi:hypothetical protein